MQKRLIINTDGGCYPNPGNMGIGVVIQSETGETKEISRSIGKGTNNMAEYSAVVVALEEARDMKATHLIIRSDSQLLIRQLNGSYRVKNPKLRPLYKKAVSLVNEFDEVVFEWTPRNNNSEADKLANSAATKK